MKHLTKNSFVRMLSVLLVIALTFSTVIVGGTATVMAEEVPYSLNDGSNSENTIIVGDEVLQYTTDISKPDNERVWQDITPDLEVTPDMLVRVYKPFQFRLDAIDDYNYTLTYQMPDGLLVTPMEDVDVGNGLGTINVSEDGLVTYVFDPEVFAEKKMTDFSTSVSIITKFDIDKITDDQVEIHSGNLNISINLSKEYIYNEMEIPLIKSVPEIVLNPNDNKYYLKYTLTATPTTNVDRAYVKDFFATDVEGYFDEDFNPVTATVSDTYSQLYMGTLENNTKPTPDSGSKSMIWELRNLTKETEYSVTYYALPKNGYPTNCETSELKNTAQIFVGTASDNAIIDKGSDTKTYKPTATMDIQKTSNGLKLDTANNQYYCDYRVRVTNNNYYRLNDIDLYDYFESSLAKYVEYVPSSFKLEANGKTSKIDESRVVINTANGANNYRICLGAFEAGESQYVTYRVYVSPDAIALNNGSGATGQNIAEVYYHTQKYFNRYRVNNSFTNPWLTKNSAQTQLVTPDIHMSGDVYYRDANGTVQKETNPPASFSVPALSYKYVATVNKTGVWDINNASLIDVMDSNNHQYIGYAKITAYSATGNTNLQDITTNSKNAVKTVWYKVDQTNNFRFIPRELGFDGTYAYVIEYYQEPTVGFSTSVNNQISINGTNGVSFNNKYYTINQNTIIRTDTAGASNCKVTKMPYDFYTPDGVAQNKSLAYPNTAALYWIIKVEGDLKKDLTIFENASPSVSGTVNYDTLEDDWLYGVYVGNEALNYNTAIDNYSSALRGNDVRNYNNYCYNYERNVIPPISEFSYENNLARLDSSAYSVISKTSTSASIRLTENISSEYMYIVVKTRLDPTGYTSLSTMYVEANSAGYNYDPNSSKIDGLSTAKLRVYKKRGIEKTKDGNVGVYRYDGEKWTQEQSDGSNKEIDYLDPPKDGLPGTYTSWILKVNVDGSIGGKATIVDDIPSGLEFEKLQLTGIGAYLGKNEPTNAEPDWESIGLYEENCDVDTIKTEQYYYGTSSKWDSKLVSYDPATNKSVFGASGKYVLEDNKCYYNRNLNKLIFAVDSLRHEIVVANADYNVNYVLNFRVLCKVKEADYINQNSAENTFTNKATIYSPMRGIAESSASVKVKMQSLLKSGDTLKAKRTGIYHYTIVSNPDGVDLIDDEDTIVVNDKLSSALSIKENTISVTHADGTLLELGKDYKVEKVPQSDGGTIVKFHLPDNETLYISYDVKVTVPAGQSSVNISNVAYWEGEPPLKQSQVIDNGFKMTIDTWGESYSSVPTVEINKIDAVSKQRLSGSAFSLYEVGIGATKDVYTEKLIANLSESSDGQFTFTSGTDVNGKNYDLKYNQVYAVKETTAPTGYILDTTPHYFAITRTNSLYLTDYQKLIEDMDALSDLGIVVEFQPDSTCKYTLNVENFVYKVVFHENFNGGSNEYTNDVFRTYYTKEYNQKYNASQYSLTDTLEINQFWDIPDRGDEYIFKGWYYYPQNDRDAESLKWDKDVYPPYATYNGKNSESHEFADTHIYAHWIKVDVVDKVERGDYGEKGESKEDVARTLSKPYCTYDNKIYGTQYRGFELVGVQIRHADFDPNFPDKYYSDYSAQPDGLRFISVVRENLLAETNALFDGKAYTSNKQKYSDINLEYGHVVGKKSSVNYTEMRYRSTCDNGEDTTYQKVSNMNCTSAVNINGKAGTALNTKTKILDHKNFKDYRLYTSVVTYNNGTEEAIASAKASDIVARAYMRYTDANGLYRTFYNDYSGTNSYGGCCTNYNYVLSLM